jgi:putative copper resistance protein D
LIIIFSVLGLIATIFGFLFRGASLTGDMSGMIDPEMLGLLWNTPVGTVFILRVVGLSLIFVGLFLERIGIWISIIGGIPALMSFAQIGHISGNKFALAEFALLLHLLAIAFWIGMLIPLKRLASSSSTYIEAAKIGHRFGVIASVTVPILIVMGGYMSFELVGSIAALTGTAYGQALIIKVVLVGSLLGLAAANKIRFIPALGEGDPNAAKHLSRSIIFEWIIILAVLCLTAVLTTNLALP